MQNRPVITLISGRTSGIAATTLTVGDIYAGLQNYDAFVMLINITGAGVATGTLQIYIQDSWDAGTTWDDLISSNTFAFGASLTTQRFVIQGKIATSATQGSAAAIETLAAGTVRSGPFGDRIRIREKVSGPAGSPTGATYTITLIPCRSENN